MQPAQRTFRFRTVLAMCLAGFAGLIGLGQPAWAQADAAKSYPNKPIRLVVPFAAGGTSDVLARLIGQKLGEALGQQIVVDNRPGANGNIGSDAVAKSAADGYTLLLAADGTIVINPSLYSNLPFNPEKDFVPITRVALVPLVIVANPTLKANTVSELITLSKKPDSQLDFSSAGPGSTGHLAGELLKSQSGLRMTHIPYKGGGQAITDVVSGQVPLLVTALATAGPFLKSGQLKAIAVTSSTRMRSAPTIPTVNETGVVGFNVSSWYGIMAPAGTPAPIVKRLNSELMNVLKQPEVKARMETLGAEPMGDTPQEFAAVINKDLARWARIIKVANISFQ